MVICRNCKNSDPNTLLLFYKQGDIWVQCVNCFSEFFFPENESVKHHESKQYQL